MQPRLKDLIVKEIQPNLKEKFGYKNLYMGPQIQKIVINMGLGLDGNDAKILKSCEEDLANITGQKPVVTKFKKSIANFKTRKNTNAGLKVTLRKNKMYEFIDRLVNIAIFTSLSINSYILFFLNVTFKPAFVFFLVLKFAIDFLNLVTTGFCPVIFAKSSSQDLSIFASFPSSPNPIFITIFCI